jgi:uncharacterized DUF497 family protein
MRFEFDWDPAKAESNRRKHGVAFEDAMGVFFGPLALSRLDEDSGQGEERWVTIGRNPASNLLLVVHTYMSCRRSGQPYASFRRVGRHAEKPANMRKGDLMKDEYDFSTAERGKFFREGARLVPPVHLEPEVLDYLSERASARGVSLSSLVNTLLKKDIELIDAGK